MPEELFWLSNAQS